MLDILDEPDIPSPAKAPSLAGQIKALKPGNSVAKVQRLAITSNEAADLAEFVKRFRQGVDAFVSKERKNALKDFAVEQSVSITGAGFILVVLVVTRV